MNRPVFRRQGILFVISAPSGTGKSTLCENLRATPDFIYSISCTTRPPRKGEENGIDYHFLSREDFQRRIERGEMLEYALVHDNYYGTLKATGKEALDHIGARERARMSRSALQLHLRHGAMSSAWPPRLSGDELTERDPEQESVDARDRTDRRVERGIQ